MSTGDALLSPSGGISLHAGDSAGSDGGSIITKVREWESCRALVLTGSPICRPEIQPFPAFPRELVGVLKATLATAPREATSICKRGTERRAEDLH